MVLATNDMRLEIENVSIPYLEIFRINSVITEYFVKWLLRNLSNSVIIIIQNYIIGVNRPNLGGTVS